MFCPARCTCSVPTAVCCTEASIKVLISLAASTAALSAKMLA